MTLKVSVDSFVMLPSIVGCQRGHIERKLDEPNYRAFRAETLVLPCFSLVFRVWVHGQFLMLAFPRSELFYWKVSSRSICERIEV